MAGEHAGAWDEFWKRDVGKGRGGCLPEAWQGIDAVQRTQWQQFARELPKGARVLDIATGDGRVMHALLSGRRDLKPVGIDLARKLPPPPRGTKVRTGIAMDDLPYNDNAFSAVTSQFGFEYGDMPSTAREIARVAAPGARVGLMCHRADSPIVEQNRRRHDAILWALEKKNLAGIAIHSLSARGLGLTVPPAIVLGPEQGIAAFGQGSAAWEIAEAIRQTLILGQRAPVQQVVVAIRDIVAQARNELGRIASLEAAAAAAGDGDAVVDAMGVSGFRLANRETLLDRGSERPFATLLSFKPE